MVGATEELPGGVAQLLSPRQKVIDDALVPELRFVTGRLPVTPVDKGNPVAFVRIAAVGVPNAGVTKEGEVANTTEPVPVDAFPNAVKVPEVVGKVNVVLPAIAEAFRVDVPLVDPAKTRSPDPNVLTPEIT